MEQDLNIQENLFFNKWSAYDFMNMFTSYDGMRLLDFQLHYNTRDLWFIGKYPWLFPNYSIEDVIISGFRLIYKKS